MSEYSIKSRTQKTPNFRNVYPFCTRLITFDIFLIGKYIFHSRIQKTLYPETIRKSCPTNKIPINKNQIFNQNRNLQNNRIHSKYRNSIQEHTPFYFSPDKSITESYTRYYSKPADISSSTYWSDGYHEIVKVCRVSKRKCDCSKMSKINYRRRHGLSSPRVISHGEIQVSRHWLYIEMPGFLSD